MRITLSPAVVLLIALAACSASDPVESTFNAQAQADRQAAKERAADRRAREAGFVPDQPAPLQTVSVDPPKVAAPGLSLPAADRQYRYLGRWAATPASCEAAAWRFRTRSLAAAGGTSCNLPNVATIPSGYELSGTCRTQGRKTDQTLKLNFDETKRTMSVRGQTVGPATLIYCGD